MARPLVSVIIPSYNYGRYLERSILSAIGQLSPGQVQVIVADGGSGDESPAILQRFASRIVSWSRPDKGYVDAVTQALDVAEADVVGILSADDFYLAGALRNALGALEREPRMALVCGRELFLTLSGEINHETPGEGPLTPRSMLLHHIPPQNATFVRRGWIDRVGGLRLLDGSNFAADVDLWYRILHFAPGRYLPVRLSVHQRHDQQMTRDVEKIFKSLKWMVESCAADPELARRLRMDSDERQASIKHVELLWMSLGEGTRARAREIAAECLDRPEAYSHETLNLARNVLGKAPRRSIAQRALAKGIRLLTALRQKIVGEARPALPDLEWWRSVAREDGRAGPRR